MKTLDRPRHIDLPLENPPLEAKDPTPVAASHRITLLERGYWAFASLFAILALDGYFPVAMKSAGFVGVLAVVALSIFCFKFERSSLARDLSITVAAAVCASLPIPLWSCATAVCLIFLASNISAELRRCYELLSASVVLTALVSYGLLVGLSYGPINETSAKFIQGFPRLSGYGLLAGLSSLSITPIVFAFAWLMVVIARRKLSIKQALGLTGAVLVITLLCLYLDSLVPILLSIPFLLGLSLRGMPEDRKLVHGKKVGIAMGAGVLAAITFCLLMMGRPTVVAAVPHIAFVGGGMKTFEATKADDFTEHTEADFAALPQLLNENGFRASIIPEKFAAKDLAGMDAVAVINPDKEFTEDQLLALEDFVKSGKAMLVLGDHTNIGGVMGPVNQVLRKTDIRLKFDSAIPMDDPYRWTNSLVVRPFQGYAPDNGQLGISVGASLEAGPRAEPTVMAQYGFSDKGNPNYGLSRLGNRIADPDERVGGLVLAARQRLGSVVVVAFGDTSGFQTNPLAMDHEQILKEFRSLLRIRPWPIDSDVAGWLLLAALASVVLFVRSRWAAMVTALSMTVCWAAANSYSENLVHVPLSRARAIVDMSHFPAYPNSNSDFSLLRFSDMFIRFGDVLQSRRTLDDVLGSHPQVISINGPRQSYSLDESKKILDYVAEGHGLLIACGHKESENVKNLLAPLKIEVTSVLTGAAHRARVWSVWRPWVLTRPDGKPATEAPQIDKFLKDESYDADIRFGESYALKAPDAEVLASTWDYPLAVAKSYGKGHIVVISDSQFFTARCLGKEYMNVANNRFLYKVLEHLYQDPGTLR